ncbi:MAG: (d)CMP kinase [Flavobacteriaceae bacterium]|nr:(d)CMP kinase [Flavobacteriaceae bacterium]
MKKITIAIDGFSSTGKSTIAKHLAQVLNYIYVDTGAMYRAVTYFAMKNNLIGDGFFKVDELIAKLDEVELKFIYNPQVQLAEMYLNDENVEQQIRTLEVSNFVSNVSTISEVRKKLVEQQQKMGAEKGVVMDGRDIGTVVFPKAELKLFLNASADKRANRRFQELINKGDVVSYEEILENVKSRDYIDSNREDSPLVVASDAIEIDNSDMTKEEQFEKIYQIVQQKLQEN